jgi:hypothetical protein
MAQIPPDHGYTPDERRKLVDTSLVTFRWTFGCDANTAAARNPDAISAAHLSDLSDKGVLAELPRLISHATLYDFGSTDPCRRNA